MILQENNTYAEKPFMISMNKMKNPSGKNYSLRQSLLYTTTILFFLVLFTECSSRLIEMTIDYTPIDENLGFSNDRRVFVSHADGKMKINKKN